jgi:glyoxylase-like metal-dependent hydrolase (beta-lactamase superfamily II)
MRRNVYFALVALAAVAAAACAPAQDPAPAETAPLAVAGGDVAASGTVPGTTAEDAIAATVEALGGAERIAAVRNISLMGYAHYAYQEGGGNITALPDAPQKYIEAVDLQRIYDLENARYYQQERRNDLFPFAAYGGHSFALNRQALDGDVAFNINQEGQANRGGDARDRRMWMHTNPVVAVRAALDPANTLGNRREEGGLTLVDITLAEGDLLTLAIRPPTNLPAFVRWIGPNENLGEVVYTTHYSGFVPFDGVYLPYGYNTKIDWRDIEFMKMWVDGYYVDTDIQDLSAPAPGAGGGGGGFGGGGAVEAEQVARGVWRITGGTMVIEFADHMTLYEVGGGRDRVRNVVELARTLVPEKPVTEVIVSHHHFDHTRGFRQAVAEGLTVISRRTNGVILGEVSSRPAPNFPDDLQTRGLVGSMEFIPVDDMLVLEDDTMRVELYHTINNNHTADNLIAYIPEHRMLIEADVATAAEDLQWWGDSWIDNVEYRNLDVVINVPVHMTVMDRDEVLEMVAPGVERVKQWCDEHAAEGNFFPGCPAFLR